ncbi:MAG TPA: CAP domain-containing protein [Candidatus Limnocylindrales bacterium]|nr:CAP domain-containing protein [Candidatus Limnocylindrales bacterium]
MPIPLAAALRRLVLALTIAAALTPALTPPPAQAASYSGFYTDFASEELMRLTNLDRKAYGKSALKVDQFLVDIARDRPFICPSNGKKYPGRARDMAARDYLSHNIKNCRRKNGSPFTIQTILRKHDYSTYTGENIGVNNWPDTAATYKYGCSQSGSGCDGTTTSTAPVATVQRMWMQSSGHRVNILNGNYDRFGCAAWDRSDGKTFFACVFARGGPKPIDRTGPSLSGLSGEASPRRSDKPIYSATLGDGFRLSDGWVQVDGSTKWGWSYDLNVKSDTRRYTLDASTLSPGQHTITWYARDVANRVTKASQTITVR